MHMPLAGGFKYILMCSDNSSFCVWAFSLCAHAKNIVAKLDKDIFELYGAYEEIAYDGAKQLCGVEMASFLKMWDLRGVQIHVGQKNSNRCEGDISRLRKAMKKVSENSSKTWPLDLKRILLNLNSSPIPS
jgi:hypothetical protein